MVVNFVLNVKIELHLVYIYIKIRSGIHGMERVVRLR
jgi:hypothetical protein